MTARRKRPTTAEPSMPLSKITIGRRHRKALDAPGDSPESIARLAESIKSEGLLHPVVVNLDGKLVAGERRLEACKRLGWTDVPITVRDVDVVRGELAENLYRKDFLPSEIDAIRRKLEAEEKAAAKKRQGTRNDLREIVPEVREREQRVRDRIGAFTGVSGRTVERIAAVVDAAMAEPEKYGKLAADMDRTCNVNGPFKRLKVMRQAEAIRAEPPPYPGKGPYRVIVADPPWAYELRREDSSHRAVHAYATMSLAQICAEAEKVRALAHDDCILWLWFPNHYMRESFEVLDAWGFDNKVTLTWGKDRFGTGDTLRGQTEHCHLAMRGKPIVELTNQSTLFLAPMREASRKPNPEFLPFVERLCPAPRYAYLFAREEHEGWDCHGDEVDLFAGASR